MLQKHYDLYFKRLSHREQAFYRYNDIEKNYKKNQEKVKDVIIHQSNQAKKIFT